ncbi:vitamin K epoxide reductase family protein [Zhouia sp. PK063]|uniref:vitamin K epoxide reductase family protein n=1 Tax=Zhouia sp. PK063 TaxID=3373602 RepID=UPI00378F3B53
MNNSYIATTSLLKSLQIKFTKKFIEDAILTHADHTSFLSISDTLNLLKIENMAVKVSKEKFEEIPLPAIFQIERNRQPFFYVVTKKDIQYIYGTNENGQSVTLEKEKFIEQWTGISLLAEKSNSSQEPNIAKKIKDKRLSLGIGILIGICLAIFFGNYLFTSPNIFEVTVSGVLSIGLAVSVMLLWYGVDQYNPVLQSFCSGGKKVDCNAVLTSKHSKLLGDQFNWSILSFSYFFAAVMSILFTSFSPQTFQMLAYISVLSVIIIPVSVYIQAFKIKQWCKFCVAILAVLVVAEAIFYFTGYYAAIINFSYSLIFLYTALFLIPVLTWSRLKPVFNRNKELRTTKRSLKKIKNNPLVFKSLLENSNRIESSVEGLGIELKNLNPKFKVTKVCNPYCGPCATAHPYLHELYEKGLIDLQIIFTATNDENDRSLKPVRHLLAINNSGGDITQALDDWYLANEKDYDIFKEKYPVVSNALEGTNKQIEEMMVWCKNQKITHTPTIFINGYELPKEYSYKELEMLF